ncbi:hypothetical protein H696_05351 [Fonticula alba]|uniref:Uncharacterized protein n=1 Tax=Fonticula alba TaxID=691883 RepID=A0A058Z1F2_FONAL|nr:hypothetical protein H696_05351 [Fonticula alba]KCV68099.1 hypothetical protein H696_05351 [Fonticula alba]|eukprot:XP_009497473.1 hypothetical protein H696_05351 [Fonticula alba]
MALPMRTRPNQRPPPTPLADIVPLLLAPESLLSKHQLFRYRAAASPLAMGLLSTGPNPFWPLLPIDLRRPMMWQLVQASIQSRISTMTLQRQRPQPLSLTTRRWSNTLLGQALLRHYVEEHPSLMTHSPNQIGSFHRRRHIRMMARLIRDASASVNLLMMKSQPAYLNRMNVTPSEYQVLVRAAQDSGFSEPVSSMARRFYLPATSILQALKHAFPAYKYINRQWNLPFEIRSQILLMARHSLRLVSLEDIGTRLGLPTKVVGELLLWYLPGTPLLHFSRETVNFTRRPVSDMSQAFATFLSLARQSEYGAAESNALQLSLEDAFLAGPASSPGGNGSSSAGPRPASWSNAGACSAGASPADPASSLVPAPGSGSPSARHQKALSLHLARRRKKDPRKHAAALEQQGPHPDHQPDTPAGRLTMLANRAGIPLIFAEALLLLHLPEHPLLEGSPLARVAIPVHERLDRLGSSHLPNPDHLARRFRLSRSMANLVLLTYLPLVPGNEGAPLADPAGPAPEHSDFAGGGPGGPSPGRRSTIDDLIRGSGVQAIQIASRLMRLPPPGPQPYEAGTTGDPDFGADPAGIEAIMLAAGADSMGASTAQAAARAAKDLRSRKRIRSYAHPQDVPSTDPLYHSVQRAMRLPYDELQTPTERALFLLWNRSGVSLSQREISNLSNLYPMAVHRLAKRYAPNFESPYIYRLPTDLIRRIVELGSRVDDQGRRLFSLTDLQLITKADVATLHYNLNRYIPGWSNLPQRSRNSGQRLIAEQELFKGGPVHTKSPVLARRPNVVIRV